MRGATRIYAIDVNSGKFDIAKEFGATDCLNPTECDLKAKLLEKEKWGINFTYDCTGNVAVMRDALEMAHRGFGESTVIGVAAAGKEISTRPFQLVTGRCWKGTAFGGFKSVQDVPKLANKALLNEMPIKKFITHNFDGLDKIQELVDALHGGQCLRGVLKISDYQLPTPEEIQVKDSKKCFGGSIKTVSHWSKVNDCLMTFNIYLPEDDVKLQRGERFPAVYFLSGLTSNHENCAQKGCFGQ
jgi:hypothetical protein